LPPALRRAAIAPTRRPAIPLTLRRPMIAMALHRPALALNTVLTHGVFAIKLVAGVLAAGTVALAIMNNRDVKPATTGATTGYELASIGGVPGLGGNETVVFRRPSARVQEPIAAADESDQPVSYYRRAIQTIRFLNPTPRVALASATPESSRGLIKVHGFAAFAPKEGVEPDGSGSILRRDRKPSGGSAMDEIDDYLWEVYQRQPVKRDSTGDFTWKDPAAASRMGLSLQEYVIEGMDPGFRERLYRAGRAMDADGIQWSMLSAFRDDYRQRLASGFKARTGNSLHGGSRRTGGYGHGRAIDITTAEGDAQVVWRWVDVHGSKYGLQRPMPGNDPAHIQQAGEWKKVATREARGRVAGAGGGRHKRKVRFARR
jgi:hypothetical protein